MKIYNLKYLLFIPFLFFLRTSICQEKSLTNEFISVKKLNKDLNILKHNLETIHAGLYNYTSKKDIDVIFEKIRQKIKKPMTTIEFYRLIVVLHKYIKNGHTIIIPSEKFENLTAPTRPIFPLDIYWDKSELYVLRNNSNNPSIKVGSKIDSINGYKASELFSKMSNLWTRDGNNKTFPEGITQRAFSGFYVNLIGIPKTYEIVYINKESKEKRKITIQGLTSNEIEENRTERYGDLHYYWQKEDGDPITLEIKNRIALLKIKTCSTSDIRKFGKSVRSIVNKHFKHIMKNDVEHLIIDIRDNGGGEEIITRELLRHLSPKPFILSRDSYLIANKIPNKKMFADNVGLLNTFAKIGLYKGKDEFYRLNAFGRLVYRSSVAHKKYKPSKDVFFGKIYTITNAYTFSEGGSVASSLKTLTNSTFIGEEPGGNSNKHVAGLTLTLILPNSGNRIIIPLANQFIYTSVKESDRGVIPDHKIRNTIDDIINGRDAPLKYTYQLIKNSN